MENNLQRNYSERTVTGKQLNDLMIFEETSFNFQNSHTIRFGYNLVEIYNGGKKPLVTRHNRTYEGKTLRRKFLPE